MNLKWSLVGSWVCTHGPQLAMILKVLDALADETELGKADQGGHVFTTLSDPGPFIELFLVPWLLHYISLPSHSSAQEHSHHGVNSLEPWAQINVSSSRHFVTAWGSNERSPAPKREDRDTVLPACGLWLCVSWKTLGSRRNKDIFAASQLISGRAQAVLRSCASSAHSVRWWLPVGSAFPHFWLSHHPSLLSRHTWCSTTPESAPSEVEIFLKNWNKTTCYLFSPLPMWRDKQQLKRLSDWPGTHLPTQWTMLTLQGGDVGARNIKSSGNISFA